MSGKGRPERRVWEGGYEKDREFIDQEIQWQWIVSFSSSP